MAYFQNICCAELGPQARTVYMYLKDHADKSGQCWTGIKTIAAELGLSRSTVKRALDGLCHEGLISKDSLEQPTLRELNTERNNYYLGALGIVNTTEVKWSKVKFT